MKKAFYSLLIVGLMGACARAPLHMQKERRFLHSGLSGFSSRVIENSNVVTDGEHLYLGARAGFIYSADGKNGKERWNRKLNGAIDAIPLVVDQTVFVGTIKGEFYALNKTDGKIKWQYSVVGEVVGQPSVMGQSVFFGTHLGHVYALDADKGAYLWRYKRDPSDRMVVHAFTTPLTHKNRLAVGFADGSLLCLDAQTGDKVWTQSWTDSERFSDIAWLTPTSEKTMVVGKFNGQLAGYNIEDGAQLWTSENASSAAVPAMFEQKVITGTTGGNLQMIEPTTGQVSWTYDSKKPFRWSGIKIYQNYVLASTFDGSLIVLNVKDGSFVWEYSMGYSILGPAAVANDLAWLLTAKGLLISLRH